MNQQIIEAIEQKQLVEFNYDGGRRVVEPHCYGRTTKGNEGLRAFQVDGYSSTGSLGWKMFDLGKASGINVLSEEFSEPRPGYSRGDKGMSEIYCEL